MKTPVVIAIIILIVVLIEYNNTHILTMTTSNNMFN